MSQTVQKNILNDAKQHLTIDVDMLCGALISLESVNTIICDLSCEINEDPHL